MSSMLFKVCLHYQMIMRAFLNYMHNIILYKYIFIVITGFNLVQFTFNCNQIFGLLTKLFLADKVQSLIAYSLIFQTADYNRVTKSEEIRKYLCWCHRGDFCFRGRGHFRAIINLLSKELHDA